MGALTREKHVALVDKFNQDDLSERLARATCLSLTEDEQMAVAEDKDCNVRSALAANRSAKEAVLWVLADAKWQVDTVRRAVATNESTPVDLLAHLTKDPYVWTRMAVIKNPSTPQTLLRTIARNEGFYRVRAVLAASHVAGGDILEFLALDEHQDVRLAVAENRFAPIPLLKLLSNDSAEEIRVCVASNPRTPADTLEFLSGSPSLLVKRAVASNVTCPDELVDNIVMDLARSDEGGEILGRLLEKRNFSLPLLTWLATEACVSGRVVLASKTRESDVLRILSGDDEVDVREQVAQNAKTPVDILLALVDDADFRVVRGLVLNSAASLQLFEKMLSRPSALNIEVLESIARHEMVSPEIIRTFFENIVDSRITLAYAGNVNTPVDILTSLYSTGSLEVRRLVISNPSLPPERLHKILKREGYRSKELAELSEKVIERRGLGDPKRGRPRRQ